MKLLILNGPNLNLLGQREPDIYGRQSYDDLCKLIYEHAAAVGCQVELFQSNHEGTLIDAIQASRAGFGGIVINPGAYAHYSYAIYDALRCAPVPAVSVTAPACVRVITGHGLAGYLEAMDYLLQHTNNTAAAPTCGCTGEALV